MPVPDRYHDWHEMLAESAGDGTIGSRERLRWLLLGMAICLTIVFGRACQLELSGGEAFRELAARPLARTRQLDATRGRILARSGEVLAADEPVSELAVQYRWLEEPPNSDWLRATARSRLSKADRRQRERIAAEQEAVLRDRSALHARLAALCEVSSEEWQARCASIQARVSALAAHVNEARLRKFAERQAREAQQPEPQSLAGRAAKLVADALTGDDTLPPAPVVIAEQIDYHTLVDRVSDSVVAELREHAHDYPGARIINRTRRVYPQGSLAAHLVGHINRPERGTPAVGAIGVERSYEPQLASRPGRETQFTDRRGTVLRSASGDLPQDGGDIVLSLDLELQGTAEGLLDRICEATVQQPGRQEEDLQPATGGAIVVLDVRTGAIAAAASAPRFDPNWFVTGGPDVGRMLNDSRHPLFDRVAKMVIPPGSIFKIVTALALIESGAIDADEPFHCQGYLREPDRERCYLFRRHGIGHGDVTLADALARSCNVYFYHHAGAAGCAPLIDWAECCGFGQTAGVDLADEAAGRVPTPDSIQLLEGHAWRPADTHALAIGQSSLVVTPLQVARLLAAVANGGTLVTPHVVARTGDAVESHAPFGIQIPRLQPATLAIVREGLRRVVTDEQGTGHAALASLPIEIAGKTGTAETGGGQADHAWFAGYAPAESPRYAFVVALEHAGGGAAVAAPVARGLLEKMIELGYFGEVRVVDRSFPPGKG